MKRFLLAYLALVALAWGWALPLPGPGATPLSAWAVREHALTLTGLWAFGMLLSFAFAARRLSAGALGQGFAVGGGEAVVFGGKVGRQLLAGKPQRVEIGGKVRIGGLFASLAAYRIERPGDGILPSGAYGYIGEQRHRGAAEREHGLVAARHGVVDRLRQVDQQRMLDLTGRTPRTPDVEQPDLARQRRRRPLPRLLAEHRQRTHHADHRFRCRGHARDRATGAAAQSGARRQS